jgi:glycosyltransferase involved in cell wall biosynthesis
MSKTRPSISVFFPAYNDARSIGKLVEDALAVLPELTDTYEVIIVNDGSMDETREVLEDLRSKHEAVRVIEHETNRGYGGALQSGFAAARYDLVFYTDGDGQYDVREIARLYPLLTEKTDVVNGYKMERTDKMNRKVIGGFYNQLAHFLFSLPVRDVDCDFRLIRRSILGTISLYSTSGSICVELVYKLRKAGAVFEETGVNHYARQHGKSQFFTVRRVSKTLLDFFILWLRLVVLRKT